MDEKNEGTMEKQKNGQFVREMPKNKWKRNMELAENSWLESWNGSHVVCCIRTANSKKLCETKDRTTKSQFCRMCDKKSKTISHIVSKCEKLAQKEYKRRRNNVAKIVR